MSKDKRKIHKKSRKIKLPVDSTGEPIHVDDLLVWPNGEWLKVETLTYVGHGGWMAEGLDKGEYSDNLGAATIVSRDRA